MFFNIKKILQTTFILTSLLCITSYAKEVTFTLNAPNDFNKRVEVYLNRDPHPMPLGSKTMTLDLKEEVYDVFIMSSEDFANKYEFSYPEKLDVSTTDNINIEVKSTRTSNNKIETLPETTTEFIETESESNNETENNTETISETILETNSDTACDDEDVVEPTYYDYSEEGKASATLYISAPYYSCFESVYYQFVGEHVYDIKLNRNNNFSACVTLPVGKYYETETVRPKLDKDANAGHVSFIWVHGDNEQDCHNYYTLNEGDTLEINDLKIYMVEIDGNTLEVEPQLLFSEKRLDNLRQTINNNAEKKLKEHFSNEEIKKEPVINEAKPVEVKEETNFNYIYVIIAAGILFAIGIVVFVIKKKSEED